MKIQLALRGTGWIVLILTVSLGSGVAGAGKAQVLEQPRMEPRAETHIETHVPLSVAGVVVEVDASTGRLRPLTAEQVQALREALARKLGSGPLRSAQARQETPVPVVHADGSVTAELPAYLHEVLVVRLTPEGTVSHDCAQGLDQADALLASPAAEGRR